MITGGFRYGMFMYSQEESLRAAIHHAMLNRAGLSWPPNPDQQHSKYWSTDKDEQTRNRQIYHGFRLASLKIINNLIREVLQEAAVPEAVTQARRFRFGCRAGIYHAGAKSHRALQLIETFPALALAIYCSKSEYHFSTVDIRSKPSEQLSEASAMVERGVSLKRIAGFMGVPMALHKVKPGAAGCRVSQVKTEIFRRPRGIGPVFPFP
ncbi:MAG: hypothetical protein GY807_12210 [Gammaproteobacteria bacterium]|nr:hypothetical protein [Gammaproteobacteria bacterium]